MSPLHRGRSGVRFLSLHASVVPALRLGARYDAYAGPALVQNWPLLDMSLEEGAKFSLTHGQGTVVSDTSKLLADGFARAVRSRQPIVQIENAGKYSRCDHGRSKSRALLIGPHDRLKRCLCSSPEVIEGADDFQACEHAKGTIKSAAGGLGIEMASRGYGGARRIQAVAACKDVSHLIYTDHT